MAEPEIISYIQKARGEIEPLIQREWLLTNGIGGFAAGTVAGVNTRRYHGLLVAATLPPVGRVMTLSRFVELLMIDGQRIDLSAAIFGGELYGEGPKLLRRFELGGEVARWEFDVDGTGVTREVMTCWNINATGIRYRIRRGQKHAERRLKLNLLPLLAMRDFHAVRRRGQDPSFEARDEAVVVREGELNTHIEAAGGQFTAKPDWWLNHTYPVEAERGMDHVEDLFTPGTFEIACIEEDEVTLTLWVHLGADQGGFDWDDELARRRREMHVPPMSTPIQRKLARAAADFVVRRRRPDGGAGTTVLAGYPWFADWGRDTFIALPGLLLATGRHVEAGQVLATFADHVSEGMIPNRFDDYTSAPEYNTVDASLWFIHAAHEYARVTRDRALYERLLKPGCLQIIQGYTRGTRYNIHVDPADGLVSAGDETTQLTWMDARRDGTVFTPRHGKAVEINALWYNALMLLDERDRAEQVRRSFAEKFVGIRPEHLFEFGLYDVIDGTDPDHSVRPNQIFAVALPHSPLDREEQFVVTEVVRRKLLTPYGLRTLSADDARYQPHFTGPIFERDRAYHNGTVWPWLIGPFIDAYLKVHDRDEPSMTQARQWLRPLLDHLENDGCLGSISEVFDAEPPHAPGGCFAQAWSVSEVLRLAVRLEL